MLCKLVTYFIVIMRLKFYTFTARLWDIENLLARVKLIKEGLKPPSATSCYSTALIHTPLVIDKIGIKIICLQKSIYY